jgi:hypothetical protein
MNFQKISSKSIIDNAINMVQEINFEIQGNIRINILLKYSQNNFENRKLKMCKGGRIWMNVGCIWSGNCTIESLEWIKYE